MFENTQDAYELWNFNLTPLNISKYSQNKIIVVVNDATNSKMKKSPSIVPKWEKTSEKHVYMYHKKSRNIHSFIMTKKWSFFWPHFLSLQFYKTISFSANCSIKVVHTYLCSFRILGQNPVGTKNWSLGIF